ncbi:MAG: MATE family efflux transporter, partial [Bacteroidota bacterium]
LVLPFLSLVFMALTFFPAINEGKYGSIIGLARQVVFYVPVMLLLPRYFGIEWIYFGATAIDLLLTIWIASLVIRLFKKIEKSQKEKVQKTAIQT